MVFNTLDFTAIRANILRDIENQPRPDGKKANVAADGDYAIRANSTGAAIEGLYQHQEWIARQIFPDTSDDDILERHASLVGLFRKKATIASGSVLFSGAVGSPIPSGTEAKTAAGVSFITTATGNIGAGGTVALAAQASTAGASGNQSADTSLTLTAAPSGVESTASIVGMTGGTDIETSASLLSRLLFRLRNPPAGGAAHDYYSWATNVDGVTEAFVYRHRRGLGTVDVIILTSGGLAGAELIAAVQAYIETVQPVEADVLVFAPTAVPVDFDGALALAAGYSLAAVSAAIDAVLAAYFNALAPGDTAYLNRQIALIADTPGVTDFTLASPLASTAALVDATHTELVTLGTTNWVAA